MAKAVAAECKKCKKKAIVSEGHKKDKKFCTLKSIGMIPIPHNIGIIGSGIVGQATGKGLVNLVNNVVFYDIDTGKIKSLVTDGYNASVDMQYLVDNSDITIIESSIRELLKAISNKNKYFLIVIKSTVIPTTTERLIPLIKEKSNKKVGVDFSVCFNPEFLGAAHAQNDFMHPDRIIIGEYDTKSGDTLKELYKPFQCPIVMTELRTAEMSKYANNCFNATKISFFNEIHLMCQEIGIDSNTIRKIVQMDRYYSVHHWEHGNSFGGKCLPKDLNDIIYQFDKGHIHNPALLKAVRKVNKQIKSENKNYAH